ncbi:histidine phosphatase family protein [Loigolactobacillus bifermentans]|uniref:Phosphoglycerate mutase n=1 Tax=Loigolactobacillus bifermentans DSM 20003 TaxID=1423726 RepID=A0A0R1H271_9LACO|nr:histidine phosphatase family protein [Loigolactobacillus bifermentans]KRK40511.1 phosphoglycerate mutase [Loigolactobacillus bifermentans DSM 20003]QGG61187.1 histidine phosphatase family protein [Loigolactobacillus bifermentans]
MAAITVYFVRHGQTYFNTYRHVQGWSDSPLTQQGILDAQQTGQRLAQIHFDQAYCSDTMRARHTAQMILQANQASALKQPQELTYFREVFFGSYEGMPAQEVWPMVSGEAKLATYPELIQKYTITQLKDRIKATDPTHQAENNAEYWQRTDAGFDYLRQHQRPGSQVLLVSHGAAMSSIVAKYGQGHYDVAQIPRNGAVTKLLVTPETVEVAYYNRVDEGPLS